MKTILWSILCVGLLFFFCGHVQAAEDTQDYLLGPGDIIEVIVWGDDSLSRTVRVRPDGKISYPLVGEIKVAEKTIETVRKAMQDRMSEYVSMAEVTVILQDSVSKTYYIIGDINSPGAFPMYDKVTVLQALAIAGGLDPFADEDDIMILRFTDEGREVIKFDYSRVSEGKQMEQDIYLEPKDVIIVH